MPKSMVHSCFRFKWMTFLILCTGKKRGATVRLSNVTVNAPSVLKHEEELESLAAVIPADYDERRKSVNKLLWTF